MATEEGKTGTATASLKDIIDKASEGFNKFREGGTEGALPVLRELGELIPGIGPGVKILGAALDYGLPLIKKFGEYAATAKEQLGSFKTTLDRIATSLEAAKDGQTALERCDGGLCRLAQAERGRASEG